MPIEGFFGGLSANAKLLKTHLDSLFYPYMPVECLFQTF